jgi:dipeptidyl aminopeptidase/acylaminoacyl peptidase
MVSRSVFRVLLGTSLLAALVLLSACAVPETAEEPPPLIDRKIFFDDPKISGAQVSPDGKWVSFRKPHEGVMNIWVKGLDEPFDAARPITADKARPVVGYFWTEDSRYVLYVQDKGGNENFHVFAVDPAGEPSAEGGVPEARNLTPIDGVRAAIYALPESTPNEIIVGLNDRNPALHDVYRLNIDTGERTLVLQNDYGVGAWVTDLDGNVRMAFRQLPDGGSEILNLVDGKLEQVYACTWLETCQPMRFHKDGERVYMISNKGDDVDLSRLMLLDPKTGETELVHEDPEGEVDFGGPLFSDATEELIGVAYMGDRLRIYPFSDELKKDLEFLRANLPDGELGAGSGTNDDNISIVSVSRDVDPGSVYIYNRAEGTVEKLYESRPELPKEHLAEMRPLRYPARDGREIPAYLTVPKGMGETNLPVVIFPHGGPWARDTWGYDGFAQFLANRGYAVLQPNFRGSEGYGKDFLNAGNKEWGIGAAQHDLSDAVKYLVDEGIADPERVGIMGGSYGGYATLAGVAFTPDLYAAAVDIVGPSNLITLIKSFPAYWGPFMKIWHLRWGNPDDPEDREDLLARSPLFAADQIKTPLFVIQGANDPRVTQIESDMIVSTLRGLDRKVSYMLAPDEGHGFRGRENRLAMMVAIEQFLGEHLGGRVQEDIDPEISSHLDKIMVDVATVEAPDIETYSMEAAGATAE